MQKDNPVQIELFSSADSNIKKDAVSKSVLSYLWKYEKTILLIMVLLIVSLASFSLGVRKGMQLSMLKERKGTKLESQIIEQKPQPIKDEAKTIQEKIEIKSEPAKKDAEYTIQVATYRTKTFAQKEAEKLEKNGLKTIIYPKGDYVQLCVGKFFNREDANLTLKELKKRYQDCFLRRL